jgi:hypothetical protein
MRESRLYGSVRGARGNSRPYRVAPVLLRLLTAAYDVVDGARSRQRIALG